MKTFSQFLSIAKPFWGNRQQWQAWLILTAVIGFSLAIISVSVWITDWNKAFYDALADFNSEIMPTLVLTYLSYMALMVGFIVLGNALRKVLIFRWRFHLTAQLQRQWLRHHNHYRLPFYDDVDNPDQRIADDVFQLAEKSIDLFKYFIMNVAKLIAFISILWQLSGVQTFDLFGKTWTLHGYLVWVALIYSVLCTLFMHAVGHKLQELNIERQHTEADYRASLLRVRENSEQIAFYHGETQENNRLFTQFSRIKANWFALIGREMKVETVSASYLRLSQFIPIFATLPMYLARTITFGDMMQARSAFSNVQDGFGWFMDYYKRLIEWSAVVKRLYDFKQALNYAEQQYSTPILQAKKAAICVQDLSVFTPKGRVLFANFSVNLTACDWVLLEGKSGVGKSTLLRTFAGLWQHYQGKIYIQAPSYLFLPQKPYLFEGSLRENLQYPHTINTCDKQLKMLLQAVGLSQLIAKLEEKNEWHKQLSGGEQQRLSIIRALLHRPALLFLDEATNQLDELASLQLMQLLKERLPETLCVAISHQREVKGLFEKKVSLE